MDKGRGLQKVFLQIVFICRDVLRNSRSATPGREQVML